MTETEKTVLETPALDEAATAASKEAVVSYPANILAAETSEDYQRNRTYSPHAALDYQNIGDIPKDNWIEKRHWTDTPHGRFGIEFASRIFLGGMFYALVGQSESMKQVSSNYDPATFMQKEKKTWLEWVAYGVDKTFGAGIKKTAEVVTGDKQKAEEFIRFRQERFLPGDGGRPAAGRSYGAEFTAVVADFGGMTVGTYIQREAMYGLLNPNERKAWLKDGKFDLGHAIKRLGSKIWEGASYNLGEDIAATLPYVFFLRGSRNVIDKHLAPGFRIISDHVDNSGGMLVKGDGTIKSEYQGAGMTDLIIRFTGYNVITQMYRDAYQRTGSALKNWKKNDFQFSTPEFFKNPAQMPEKLVQGTRGLGRYMAISTIRSLLQMLVASPFFAIIRSPLSKPSGLIVNPEYGFLQLHLEDGTKVPVRRGGGREGQPYAKYYDYDAKYNDGTPVKVSWSKAPDHELRKNPVAHFQDGPFDVYGSTKDSTRALYYDRFSALTDGIGSNLEKVAEHSAWEKSQNWFWKMTGNEERSKHMSREALLAGMPYALYFSAKVYLREKYVNEQMNLSIGRLLDGALSFNIREMREGASEIQRTMMSLPFKEPNRQAELVENHLFHPTDKSPVPENWSAEQHREYLQQHKQGIAPDALALTAAISQKRADAYAEKAKAARQQSGQLPEPTPLKLPGERIIKKEAGWAEQQANEPQNSQYVTV